MIRSPPGPRSSLDPLQLLHEKLKLRYLNVIICVSVRLMGYEIQISEDLNNLMLMFPSNRKKTKVMVRLPVIKFCFIRKL